MASLNTGGLGLVLLAMSESLKHRAQTRQRYLGSENTELTWAIAHALTAGAEKCIELALPLEDGGDRIVIPEG